MIDLSLGVIEPEVATKLFHGHGTTLRHAAMELRARKSKTSMKKLLHLR